MDSKSQIVDAEERLRQAMLSSDLAVLDELIAPELVFTSHLGQLVGKQDDLDFHRSGLFRLDALNPSEQRIRIHSEIAIVSVLMQLAGRHAGEPFAAMIRYTRVWSLVPTPRIIAGHASTLA